MAARIQVPAERVDDFISEISMIKFEVRRRRCYCVGVEQPCELGRPCSTGSSLTTIVGRTLPQAGLLCLPLARQDATSWQVYRFAFSTGQGAECKYVCVVGRHHDTEKQYVFIQCGGCLW
jgi:hypothetical protein